MITLPVFPLNVLLMPGCRMPLQIFEKRYLDMVSHCMRTNTGFCVALLRPGAERHEVIRPDQEPASGLPFYELGTEARIVDFGQRDNGLLAITIEGGQRLALQQTHQETSGLWVARAERRPEPQPERQPASHFDAGTPLAEWSALLEHLLTLSGLSQQGIKPDMNDSAQVLNHLVMLLPLPAPVRQELLACNSQSQRWQMLEGALALLSAPPPDADNLM